MTLAQRSCGDGSDMANSGSESAKTISRNPRRSAVKPALKRGDGRNPAGGVRRSKRNQSRRRVKAGPRVGVSYGYPASYRLPNLTNHGQSSNKLVSSI